MAYATQADAVYVNLFVAGKATLDLAGETVSFLRRPSIRATGEFRSRSKPRAIIRSPSPFASRLGENAVPSDLYRLPVTKATVADRRRQDRFLKGNAKTSGSQKGYALTRTWKKGDVIELNLPMPVRRVLAHEKVEANRGRVALQRGPLVYCVEAVDNGGLRTDAIVLPDDAQLHVVRRKDLLGDVVVITGEAKVAFEPRWGEPAKVRPHTMVAVPYYAWANRGEGYMDVWLPRTSAYATPLPAKTDGVTAAVSASVERSERQLAALTDRRSGPKSSFRSTPRFSWPAQTQGVQWIQYEWSQPREVSRTAVYWAVDRRKKVYWGPRIRGENLKLQNHGEFFTRMVRLRTRLSRLIRSRYSLTGPMKSASPR